jgi:hypothetical protein
MNSHGLEQHSSWDICWLNSHKVCFRTTIITSYCLLMPFRSTAATISSKQSSCYKRLSLGNRHSLYLHRTNQPAITCRSYPPRSVRISRNTIPDSPHVGVVQARIRYSPFRCMVLWPRHRSDSGRSSIVGISACKHTLNCARRLASHVSGYWTGQFHNIFLPVYVAANTS